MIEIRPSGERGRTTTDWLDSRHTFSFDHYYDPRYTGFLSLRVINEDCVAPGAGFPEHAHRNMEILTYVLDGSLAHKDSTGVASTLVVGDIQRMTAGTGITHSEFNPSPTDPAHFLQIWIRPSQRDLPPSYQKTFFPEEDMWERLCLVASPDGREKSLVIHQDAFLYSTALMPGQEVSHALEPERGAWVQVIRGDLRLNGHKLSAGDGAAVSAEPLITLEALTRCEALLINMGTAPSSPDSSTEVSSAAP